VLGSGQSLYHIDYSSCEMSALPEKQLAACQLLIYVVNKLSTIFLSLCFPRLAGSC